MRYLNPIDLLKADNVSSPQVATLRAAYQDILSILQKSVRRKIPAELLEIIAHKILSIAASAEHDSATIVQMVLNEIGVLRPEKPKH